MTSAAVPPPPVSSAVATPPRTGRELRSTVSAAQVVEVSVAEVAIGEPAPDEVVVRVEASPLNPSDLNVLLGYGEVAQATSTGTPLRPVLTVPLSAAAARRTAGRVGRPLPVGTEGAGTVVAAGSSPAASALLGRQVALAASGMYAEYRRVPAADCIPLPDEVGPEEAAAWFVNPMTALGMVETMRAEGHRALVHSAAASNLGRMLHRLCRRDRTPLVTIVRSPAQVDLLRAEGAEWVCDSSSESFSGDLQQALTATGATLLFDAIGGGTLTSRVLSAMEHAHQPSSAPGWYGSDTFKQAYLYGNLDRGPTELDRTFGFSWGLSGWLLQNFLQRVGPEHVNQLRRRIVEELTTTFASRFTERVGLTDVLRPEVAGDYARRATGSKYLVVPHHRDAD